jgi:hypothetical protein
LSAPVGFLIRELLTSDPILDLAVFTDRNFAMGATLSAIVGFGMFSGMLLVAVFTQKLLGYDAWTSGLVLAPGGLGNVFSLFASGLVTRIDQRLMLAFGCLLNAVSLYMMTSLTLGMDYWALAWPRFLQGAAGTSSCRCPRLRWPRSGGTSCHPTAYGSDTRRQRGDRRATLLAQRSQVTRPSSATSLRGRRRMPPARWEPLREPGRDAFTPSAARWRYLRETVVRALLPTRTSAPAVMFGGSAVLPLMRASGRSRSSVALWPWTFIAARGGARSGITSPPRMGVRESRGGAEDDSSLLASHVVDPGAIDLVRAVMTFRAVGLPHRSGRGR